jgi:hypothetical protein
LLTDLLLVDACKHPLWNYRHEDDQQNCSFYQKECEKLKPPLRCHGISLALERKQETRCGLGDKFRKPNRTLKGKDAGKIRQSHEAEVIF